MNIKELNKSKKTPRRDDSLLKAAQTVMLRNKELLEELAK